MAEQFLTVAEVAKRINYSTAQVRTLLRNEKIKGTRAGERGKWQISSDSVDSFIGAKTDKTESKESGTGDDNSEESTETTVITPPKKKDETTEPPEDLTEEPDSSGSGKGNGSTNFALGEAIKRLFNR